MRGEPVRYGRGGTGSSNVFGGAPAVAQHLALRIAFHQLLHAPSFEEALVRTVSQGGDADTNGAIVGALLGAVYGRDEVPIRWRRTVLTCRAFHGHQPRPRAFWATDLLELAERLVALGPVHEEG